MAAELNYARASEMVAMSYLFGYHLPQNITKAKEMFEALSMKGAARGQTVSGDNDQNVTRRSQQL